MSVTAIQRNQSQESSKIDDKAEAKTKPDPKPQVKGQEASQFKPLELSANKLEGLENKESTPIEKNKRIPKEDLNIHLAVDLIKSSKAIS